MRQQVFANGKIHEGVD